MKKEYLKYKIVIKTVYNAFIQSNPLIIFKTMITFSKLLSLIFKLKKF